MAKNWFTKLLFDWVFVLLCKLMQGMLKLVGFMESFFDVFAGTAKVTYQGASEFLINIFFAHNTVSNAFWAMALIAIVLAFGFCIVSVARKVTDVSGTVKQTVGQIMSNFIRCMVVILLLNAACVAVINVSNVLLDRINYAMENAAVLNREDKDKTFTEQEYAPMTKILATVANYSVNPSADSRYNINSCFNAVRNDLLALHVNGFFDYDYAMDPNGHHTWQSALALLAGSSDLTQDLNLDTYYSDVAYAVQTVSREIGTYADFAPVQTASVSTQAAMDTDVLIFLIAGMEAAQNGMYNNGSFDDTLRRGYITGEKDYMSLSQVRKDFDIWDMDYLVAYIACIVFIIIMAICIFTFIVRMFNLVLLYLTAPLFVSSMPLDEGGKFQSWSQAFVIQLFSGFGSVVAMRLYLIFIPIVISSDLVFFPGAGFNNAVMNRMAQLLMVLGGAWAVLQASALITGILAGNPGMAAIQQEGRIGGMVTGWAMRAPAAAVHTAGGILKAPMKMGKSVQNTRDKLESGKLDRANRREQLASRKAQRLQTKADSAQVKSEALQQKAFQPGASSRTMRQAASADRRAHTAQDRALLAQDDAKRTYQKYGGTPARDNAASAAGAVPAGVGAAPASTPRSRGPYTPEQYMYPGGASAAPADAGSPGPAPASRGARTGGTPSPGSSGAAAPPVQGKTWTPPPATGDAPAQSGPPPRPAPRSEQFVSAEIPDDPPPPPRDNRDGKK